MLNCKINFKENDQCILSSSHSTREATAGKRNKINNKINNLHLKRNGKLDNVDVLVFAQQHIKFNLSIAGVKPNSGIPSSEFKLNAFSFHDPLIFTPCTYTCTSRRVQSCRTVDM